MAYTIVEEDVFVGKTSDFVCKQLQSTYTKRLFTTSWVVYGFNSPNKNERAIYIFRKCTGKVIKAVAKNMTLIQNIATYFNERLK